MVRLPAPVSATCESLYMTADLMSCQSTCPSLHSSSSPHRSPRKRPSHPSRETMSTSSAPAASRQSGGRSESRQFPPRPRTRSIALSSLAGHPRSPHGLAHFS